MEELRFFDEPWATNLFLALVLQAPDDVLWDFEVRGMIARPTPMWASDADHEQMEPLNRREIDLWEAERRVRRRCQWPWEWACRVMQQGKTYFRDENVDVVFRE